MRRGWLRVVLTPEQFQRLPRIRLTRLHIRLCGAFRRPIVTTHLYAFYALAVMVVLHVIAVVLTELHEGGSIVSAMFTGTKLLNRPPEDR